MINFDNCIAAMPQWSNSITMVVYSRLQKYQYHRISDSRSCRRAGLFSVCGQSISSSVQSSVTSSFNCISFQILLLPALQYKPPNINILGQYPGLGLPVCAESATVGARYCSVSLRHDAMINFIVWVRNTCLEIFLRVDIIIAGEDSSHITNASPKVLSNMY